MRNKFAYLLLIGLVVFMAAAAHACPGCKEALFDPASIKQKMSAAKGFAISIGLLLSVPYLLVGGIAFLVIRAQSRKRASDFGYQTPQESAKI